MRKRRLQTEKKKVDKRMEVDKKKIKKRYRKI